MSYLSRFSPALIALGIASGCSKTVDSPIVSVKSEEYVSKKCWFDTDGSFVALIAIAENERIAVPYPISAKCIPVGQYANFGEALILNLGVVTISDSHAVLQRRFANKRVLDSSLTDQLTPSSDSLLYYVVADVTEDHPKTLAYIPNKITRWTSTKVSLGHFMEMSDARRREFLTGLTKLK